MIISLKTNEAWALRSALTIAREHYSKNKERLEGYPAAQETAKKLEDEIMALINLTDRAICQETGMILDDDEDGTSGQDRESYSDDQDRGSCSVPHPL